MTQLFNLNGGNEITSLDGAYGFYLVTVDSEGNPVQSGFVTLDTLKTFINTNPSVVPSSNPWRGCRINLSGDFSVPSASTTTVIFNATAIDTDSFWSLSSPARLTVPTGVSKVRIAANVRFATNSAGRRFAHVTRNGFSFAGQPQILTNASSSSWTVINMKSAVIEVEEGDYFELKVEQTSGSPLDVLSGTATWFEIEVVEADV